MAAVEIPFSPSVGAYRLTFIIETVQYIFDARWNTRAAAWYMDVLEADETPIALGIKIVLGCLLGRRTNHPLFNNGVLVAIDLSGQEMDATLDDFGTRVAILYYPVLDWIVALQGQGVVNSSTTS